jgi:hypothetical protein
MPSMRLAIAFTATVLLAGGALSATTYWRPAMPQFTVELRNGPGADRASLLLIYGDNGSDPFRAGTLAPDQHISDCAGNGPMCVSLPGRRALRSGRERRQSLQLRTFNGNGNPIVGGVTWTGPAYPSEVRVVCDLRTKDIGATCRVANITV